MLLPISAYAATLRRPVTTTDGTTEVAAILVVASAALAEKSTFQNAQQKIAPHELRAALKFVVPALVILPLLPRRLWIGVLLFSGLNCAGCIARRMIGETRGLAITG